MTLVLWMWAASAIAIILVAMWLGFVIRGGIFGIFIDNRGRFSLTHLQLVVWTIVVLSLISGMFFARLFGGIKDPLGFDIPNELLGLLGISVGSAVTSTVIKTQKDQNPLTARQIAASDRTKSSVSDHPFVGQIFLVEEGAEANKVIDITKFQNSLFTVFLVIAYVAQAIAICASTPLADLKALPGFSATFLTLLGISHAGYLLGKVPNRPGTPDGLTVANRLAGKTAVPLVGANP